MTSPRILYISDACHLSSLHGSHVRCVSIIRALQQVGAVEVVSLRDHTDPELPDAAAACGIPLAYSLQMQPRPHSGWIGKLRWTFDPKVDYPRGHGVSDEGLQRLLRSAKEFDILWFYKQHCTGSFPNLSWPRSVLDVDDVLSRYEQAVLPVTTDPIERVLTLRRMLSWRRREKYLGDGFSILAVCSHEDRQYLEGLGVRAPIHVIPNGFEKPHQEPTRCPAIPPRIGFIGLLDYAPNLHGVEWFVRECWPRIKREIPDARLRLVGSGTDGPLKPAAADIDGLGWMANPADEIQTWSLMAVPIHMGAGTRVKIAQAFSQKCPVVSTSLGAYGYGVQNGRELYLADSAEAFSRACIAAIRDSAQAAEIAERAWHRFLENWTWDAVSRHVWAAAEDCLRRDGKDTSRAVQLA